MRLKARSSTRQGSGIYSLLCHIRLTASFFGNCYIRKLVIILLCFIIWGHFSHLYLFHVVGTLDLIKVWLPLLSLGLMRSIVPPEILRGLGEANFVRIPGNVDVWVLLTVAIEMVLALLIEDKSWLLLLLNHLKYLFIVFRLQSFFKCFELPLHRNTQLTWLRDWLNRCLGIYRCKLGQKDIQHLPLQAGTNIDSLMHQNLSSELPGH